MAYTDTISDLVAENVRDLRKRRGLSGSDLARRCADRGAPELTAAIIRNIENGRRQGGRRRRMITVDELVALAYALDASPAHLLTPTERGLPVTGTTSATERDARLWLRGEEPLADQDEPAFRAEDYRHISRDRALGIHQYGTNEAIVRAARRVVDGYRNRRGSDAG